MPIQAPRAGGGVTDVKVDMRKWQALLERAYKFDTHSVKIGILQGKGGDAPHQAPQPKAQDGKTAHGPRQATSRPNMTLAEIAAIHEFGAPKAHIPMRSFIRSTFYVRRANALEAICGKLAKRVVTEGLEITRALGILGAWAAAEVKGTITEIDIPPPLAQRTIDAKGSSKPLVDTGQLKNSVTWSVVDDAAALTPDKF